MSMEAVYAQFDGDYESAISRLLDDARLEKYFKAFLQDTLMSDISNALDSQDFEAMFLASHTMKGNSQTMGFSNLYKSSYDLTEALRAKDYSNVEALVEAVRKDYEAVEGAAALI